MTGQPEWLFVEVATVALEAGIKLLRASAHAALAKTASCLLRISITRSHSDRRRSEVRVPKR